MTTPRERIALLRSEANMLTRPVAPTEDASAAAFAAGRVESRLRVIESREEVGPDALDRANRAVRIIRDRSAKAEELALTGDSEHAVRPRRKVGI